MARGYYDRLIDEGLAIEVLRESPVYERASVKAGCYGRVIVDLTKAEIVLTDGPGMVLWREKFTEFGVESVESEFDDIEQQGSYRASKKARAEIMQLVHEHTLFLTFNPGGGEFNGPNGFRCQITTCDDIEDLTRLREALGLIKMRVLERLAGPASKTQEQN